MKRKRKRRRRKQRNQISKGEGNSNVVQGQVTSLQVGQQNHGLFPFEKKESNSGDQLAVKTSEKNESNSGGQLEVKTPDVKLKDTPKLPAPS